MCRDMIDCVMYTFVLFFYPVKTKARRTSAVLIFAEIWYVSVLAMDVLQEPDTGFQNQLSK